jgi:hypothetical protein
MKKKISLHRVKVERPNFTAEPFYFHTLVNCNCEVGLMGCSCCEQARHGIFEPRFKKKVTIMH